MILKSLEKPTDKIVLVTGGGAGICREVVEQFLQQGVYVVVLDRDSAALDTLAMGNDANLVSFCVDITDQTAVSEVFETLHERNIMPDILVNGSGGDTRKIPFEELTNDDLSYSFDQNVRHVFHMSSLAIPYMKAQRWGRIVNFSSIAGRSYTLFSNAGYVMAKSAVIGLTKQLAYEFGKYGIAVNAVAHGPIRTARIDAAWGAKTQAERETITSQIPMQRLGSPTEAAGAVLYLCSEAAGYTSGATIDVNGGLYC